MAGWYRTIKTIKGHRYVYEQRTWRQGGRVQSESRYIGPAGAEARTAAAARPAAVDPAPRIVHHGSRTGIEGAPRASEAGTFGPGFYLTTAARARHYATHDAKVAADPQAWQGVAPQHEGVVYACDVSGLSIKPMSWDGYYALMEALLGLPPGEGIPTSANKRRMMELLAGQGYDGLHILDDERRETVIFPASLHKIKLEPR